MRPRADCRHSSTAAAFLQTFFKQDLQASIDLLSSENKKLLADITSVNAEIVADRKENEELKASVDKLCSENSQLKEEIRQLKDKIHNR